MVKKIMDTSFCFTKFISLSLYESLFVQCVLDAAARNIVCWLGIFHSFIVERGRV
jgi:hypothetical protein